MTRLGVFLILVGFAGPLQDAAAILKKGDALFEESKAAYEAARSKSSVPAFVEAGFKLEEARIKYIVIQEIGSPEQQKTAVDRIRNVNQLIKLINEGRLAISGTPAPGADVRPADPKPPPPSPDSKPPPSDLKAVASAPLRAAVPDASRQREVEKLIRDLFKDQYAKKAPGDRLALIRTLLDQGAKSTGGPVEQWVLWREALDLATQTGDVTSAMEAIDATAQLFDVDALTMKNTALAALSKSVKSPDEFASVTTALHRLVDELIAIDDYGVAEKAAATATTTARRANDATLVQASAARAKDVGEAKAKFQAMKGFLETLARNPDDGPANLEMGQFLCFFKGNWDLGLRFLAKGSDPALKGLAEKEVALPTEAAAQAEIADAWWDLAQKEKGLTRKERMIDRARSWYQAALVQAQGLLKLKLERRMAELGPEARGSIDLLKLIDPRQDFVGGSAWRSTGSKLVSPAEGARGQLSILRVPYIPPPEYDLVMTIQKLEEKRGHDGSFDVGCAFPGGALSVVFDATQGFLYVLGAEGPNHGGSDVPGKLFTAGKSRNVVIALRKTGVTVTVDGTAVMQWKADTTRIAMYYTPDRDCMYLASWIGYSISKFELIPVTGSGRKKR